MKHLSFWTQMLFIGVIIPAMFFLKFRRVDVFALGFTAFLLLLSIAVRYLPAFGDRYSADLAQHPVLPGPFDMLAPIWLLCIPFAPFVVWLIGSLTVVSDNNWQLILGSKTFICVVLPLVSVLPMFKYVRGASAPIAMLILAIGTLFPMFFGLTSLQDLRSGPQRENVVITNVRHVTAYVRRSAVETKLIEVELEDGRTLTGNTGVVTAEVGPRRIKFLRSTKTLLGIQRQ